MLKKIFYFVAFTRFKMVKWTKLSIEILFLILSFVVCSLHGQVKQKPVVTNLSAKWADTPLLLEAAEYIADESHTAFWGFVKMVSDKADDFSDELSKLFVLLPKEEFLYLIKSMLLLYLS